MKTNFQIALKPSIVYVSLGAAAKIKKLFFQKLFAVPTSTYTISLGMGRYFLRFFSFFFFFSFRLFAVPLNLGFNPFPGEFAFAGGAALQLVLPSSVQVKFSASPIGN